MVLGGGWYKEDIKCVNLSEEFWQSCHGHSMYAKVQGLKSIMVYARLSCDQWWHAIIRWLCTSLDKNQAFLEHDPIWIEIVQHILQCDQR